jgi:hypothetical protein
LSYDSPPVLLKLEDVLTRSDFTADGKQFHALVERDLATFFDKEFKYVGIRVVTDANQNPVLRIEDHKDGSLYIDPKTNNTLMEWHTDGKDGYFSKSAEGVTTYFDRFMRYTKLRFYCRGGASHASLLAIGLMRFLGSVLPVFL